MAVSLGRQISDGEFQQHEHRTRRDSIYLIFSTSLGLNFDRNGPPPHCFYSCKPILVRTHMCHNCGYCTIWFGSVLSRLTYPTIIYFHCTVNFYFVCIIDERSQRGILFLHNWRERGNEDNRRANQGHKKRHQELKIQNERRANIYLGDRYNTPDVKTVKHYNITCKYI